MRLEARLALLLLVAALAAPALVAAKEARPAKRLSEAGRDNVLLAQAYLSSGRVDAAEDRARDAISTDGGSPLPHATLAMVFASRKQDDKAQGEFKRALALGPADGAVLNAYGAWLCTRGDRAGADAAFRSALADPGYTTPIQPLVNAGRCAIDARDWSAAEGYLRRALLIEAQNRLVLLLLAETQLKQGRAMDARAFVQRADALGPEPNTLWLAVRTEEAAGDAEAAARYQKRLREEFPAFTPTGEGAPKQ
jgi:type IV pilus assembly protein PilF